MTKTVRRVRITQYFTTSQTAYVEIEADSDKVALHRAEAMYESGKPLDFEEDIDSHTGEACDVMFELDEECGTDGEHCGDEWCEWCNEHYPHREGNR